MRLRGVVGCDRYERSKERRACPKDQEKGFRSYERGLLTTAWMDRRDKGSEG